MKLYTDGHKARAASLRQLSFLYHRLSVQRGWEQWYFHIIFRYWTQDKL